MQIILTMPSRSWDIEIVKPYICVISTYTASVYYMATHLSQLSMRDMRVIKVFSESHFAI
jgi:hypothetical protein